MIAENLLSYAAQATVVLSVGLLAPRLFRLRTPDWTLRYWQVLLAAVLVLPLVQPWRVVDQGMASVEIIGARVVESVTSAVSGITGMTVVQWSLIAVAVVAAIRLVWLAVGLFVLRRYRRTAVPLAELPEPVESLKRASGVKAEFFLSDDVPAPVTFGWRRPVVLVPPGFRRLADQQQVGVACHELLHVARRDWPVLVAENVLRAALWFHPAVHILLGRIALSREQVIDHEVIRLTGHRRQYLDALWTMARAREGRALAPALFLLNRSDLFERVALLAEEVNMSKKRVMAVMAASIVVVAGTGASAAALFPLMKSQTLHAAGPAAVSGEQTVARVGVAGDVPPVKFEVDGDITAPKAVEKVNPRYPEEARKEKIQGVVVVETVIDETGKVKDIKILRAPHRSLGDATIEAVKQWTFEPAKDADGKPVAVIYIMTIKYRLDKDKEKSAEIEYEKQAEKTKEKTD
jgi:TonB family protein